MNAFQLLLEFHPDIRLTCLLLLNICLKSGTSTHGVTDSLKTLSYKSESTNSFALNKCVLLMREVVITPVRRGGGILSVHSAPTIDSKTINLYFQSINNDDQYSTPEVLSIPDGTRIPTIEVHTAWTFLSTLKRTAPGPDELPFWIWRDYAYQLAPTITKVFTSPLKKQLVPCLWKLANVTPIPKETSFETCNQLRPISLTNVIMKLYRKSGSKARVVLCIEVCYWPRPVCLQRRMQPNLGAPYLSSSLAKMVPQDNRLCKSFLFWLQ